MTTKLVFSGFGGQGVLTLGQIVADIALHQGKEVTWMPSYGAEMRGGTANCSVIISDTVIGSPIVLNNIDILVALNSPSVDKFLPKMRDGGLAIVNSSIVKDTPEATASITKIDATNIAQATNNPRGTNTTMLAGLLSKTELFTKQEVIAALSRRFKGKQELVDLNMTSISEALKTL